VREQAAENFFPAACGSSFCVGTMGSGSISRSLAKAKQHARAGALAVVMLAIAGCASQNLAPSTASYGYGSREPSARTEIASWYGPGFEGHRTSSGERFNEYAMTAASTTLPLGSYARVTNPNNGRSVVVRINDRGPYVRGRSIDLSKGAAERLGISRRGVAPVEVGSLGSAPRMMLAPLPEIRTLPAPHREISRYRFHKWRRARAWELRRRRHIVRRVRSRSYQRYHRARPRMVWNPVGAWVVGAFHGL
jgi:rare lipoprotein A (peptidoglycan hydrolase)